MGKPSYISEEQIVQFDIYKTHNWETIKTIKGYNTNQDSGYGILRCKDCGSYVTKGNRDNPDTYFSNCDEFFWLHDKINLNIEDCNCNNLFIRYIIT